MDALIPLTVAPAHPLDPGVQELLERHFALMRATSPAESCHVMTPDALVAADTSLFAARQGTSVVGVGGFQMIGPAHAEIKSMHVAEAARGSGAGSRLLEALLKAAAEAGAERVSLETGSADAFTPARRLYTAHGFTECPPFGAYSLDPLSVFMTRPL